MLLTNAHIHDNGWAEYQDHFQFGKERPDCHRFGGACRKNDLEPAINILSDSQNVFDHSISLPSPSHSVISRTLTVPRFFTMFLTYLFLLLALALATTTSPNCSSSTPTWSDPFPEELLAITNLDAEFDYIVVGGGTAGITIASRLAEHNHRVALVEAGGIYETLSWTAKIPGADSLGVGSDPKSTSLIDWHFVTYNVPGANGRDVHYPRGKCLGGSYVCSLT